MTTPAKLIAEAEKHVGYVEGKNKDNIFGKWFGANHTAWCAEFVSYCIAYAGVKRLIAGAQTPKGFSSCGAGIKFFKAKKAWHKVEDSKPGDIAFFDWDHDGSQDHTGIIVKNDPKKKQILTIEGNTSDTSHSNGGVVKKTWRNYGVIMGVGRLDWESVKPVVKAPVAPVKPVQTTNPVSNPVATVEPSVSLTEKSSKEEILAYQVKKGLPQTGLFDEATKARISK